MKVAKNYAYSPGSRVDQFGQNGSNEITKWGNDVTGWTEAGQIWEERLAKKYYTELHEFYSQDPREFQVGDIKLGMISVSNYSPKVTNTPEFNQYLDLIKKIYLDFDAGKRFYEKIVQIKSNQVGNAIKVGSEEVIKMMVDGFMTPHVTNGASKASDLIAQTIQFIDSAVSEIKSNSTSAEPSIGTIIEKMESILDKLETSANGLKATVINDLTLLSDLRKTINDLQQKAEQEEIDKGKENTQNLDNASNTAFQWGDQSIAYSYSSNNPDEEARLAEIRAQIQAEVTRIDEDYIAFVDAVIQEKTRLYKTIGYDDGGILTNYPGRDKHFPLYVWPGVEADYSIYDLSEKEQLDALTIFAQSNNYLTVETEINIKAQDIINKYDENMEKLRLYIENVEKFIADTGTSLDDFESRINGLSSWYSQYLGGDLKSNFFSRQSNPDELKYNLKLMLKSDPYYEFTDYDYLQWMKMWKDDIAENVDNFNKNSAELKAKLIQIMSDYDSLYANLQNSGGQYIDSFNSLKKLQENSPYLEKDYYGSIAVKIQYINSIINSTPIENREAKRQEIIQELIETRNKELDFARKAKLGKINYQYDADALDRLITRVGFNIDNLELITGKNIITTSEYFSENINNIYWENINISDIPHALNRLTGQSESLGNLMFTNLELQDKKQTIITSEPEEFEKVIGEYYKKSQEYYNQIFANYTFTDIQKSLAQNEYIKLANRINEISNEYQGPPNSNYTYIETKKTFLLDKSWTIMFSDYVDESTVNSDNIYILDLEGNKLNFISPYLDVSNKQVVLENNGEFSNGQYTIVIKGTVKATNGKPLDKEVRMIFIVE